MAKNKQSAKVEQPKKGDAKREAGEKRKAENIAAQREREQANIAHKRTDPLRLTAYQRRKYDKNRERIVRKYGKYTPGVGDTTKIDDSKKEA